MNGAKAIRTNMYESGWVEGVRCSSNVEIIVYGQNYNTLIGIIY